MTQPKQHISGGQNMSPTKTDAANNLREILGRIVKAAPAIMELAIKAPYTNQRYQQEIEKAARQYWDEGVGGNFITRMNGIIKFGLRDAFILGGDDIGIPQDEMTPADFAELDKIVKEEQSHVRDLLKYLTDTANARKPLESAMPRLAMWQTRFDDVRSRAKIILGKDEKLEWVYGITEHCDTCLYLSGKVKRASYWQKIGVFPRNPPNDKLDCGGYNCQCTLQTTTKPLSKGRLRVKK